jgi:hypothetical protein
LSTIVLHKPTEKEFILISAGYDIRNYPNHIEPLYGSLHIKKNNYKVEMAAVCDSEGHLSFIAAEELIVIKIDGVSPSQIIV